MKKLLLVILAAMLIFVSCKNNEFEEILFRTTEDPFYDNPRVDSTSLENTIFINWDSDTACDCFYLMKSYDQARLNFECIYSGKETQFTDTKVETNNCYVYRLDKKRGNKIFTGQTYSYGFGSACRKDLYEPNDEEPYATFLEHDLDCNLYGVKYFTEGIYHPDIDWFYISLPPKRTAEIIVSQKGLENANLGADTNLMIQKVGSIEEAITEKNSVYITNTSDNTSKFYFKIYLNTTALFSNSSNCASVEYKVSLNKIFYYQ